MLLFTLCIAIFTRSVLAEVPQTTKVLDWAEVSEIHEKLLKADPSKANEVLWNALTVYIVEIEMGDKVSDFDFTSKSNVVYVRSIRLMSDPSQASKKNDALVAYYNAHQKAMESILSKALATAVSNPANVEIAMSTEKLLDWAEVSEVHEKLRKADSRMAGKVQSSALMEYVVEKEMGGKMSDFKQNMSKLNLISGRFMQLLTDPSQESKKKDALVAYYNAHRKEMESVLSKALAAVVPKPANVEIAKSIEVLPPTNDESELPFDSRTPYLTDEQAIRYIKALAVRVLNGAETEIPGWNKTTGKWLDGTFYKNIIKENCNQNQIYSIADTRHENTAERVTIDADGIAHFSVAHPPLDKDKNGRKLIARPKMSEEASILGHFEYCNIIGKPIPRMIPPKSAPSG